MQGEEPRETWYQPEGFFYFLATSRESCRSGVERWDVWGWREWIRHKVYRPWTMAHEVFLTPPQRLDAERRLRQFLPCWECCTKTFSSPFFDPFSLGCETGAWWTSVWWSAAAVRRCLSVIFSIFMLHFWQICLRCLTQRFPISPLKTRHTLPSANQKPLKEIWLRLCVTFELPACSASNGGGAGERRLDRSAGYLYPISITLTWCPYVVRDGV